MMPFLRCYIIKRIASAIAVALFCTACVIDMSGGLVKKREEVKRDLAQADPAGHHALIQSWYGRLLRELHQQSANGNVDLREKIEDDRVPVLSTLLQEVASNLQHADNFEWADNNILTVLQLPNRRKPIKIEVLPGNSKIVYITPDCSNSRIYFSVYAIQQIVETALAQNEVDELSGLGENLALAMLSIDASPDQLNYERPTVEALFGPPLSKFITKKVSRELGVQGTVVWKAFSFIIAHESHHIWTSRCIRAAEDSAQHQFEMQADALGTLLSITNYNRQCGRKMPARADDIRLMLDPENTRLSIPHEVALQMSLVPSPELLVGVSGIAQMQQAIGKLVSKDPSHPPGEIRLSIGRKGETALASRLYEQPIKKSLLVSIFTHMTDMTKEDVMVAAYGNIQFSPNYHLVNGFLFCSDLRFEERPERSRF